MKTYKLIKEYPTSDVIGVGDIVEFLKKFGSYTNKKTKYIYDVKAVENYPEFWEKVVEKDYSILCLRGKTSKMLYEAKEEGSSIFISPKTGYLADFKSDFHGCEIYQVKRLSDGEIFTVGDNVEYYGQKGTIEKFYSDKHDQFAFKVRKATAPKTGTCVSFDKLKKIKKLFTTEDGVDIFEGDKFYMLDTPFNKDNKVIYHQIGSSFYNNNKELSFSIKEAAEEYILLNKPCLSISDVINNDLSFKRISELRKIVKSKL